MSIPVSLMPRLFTSLKSSLLARIQLVISGKTEAVAQAEEALKAAGAKRVVRLNVSGPLHSPLLKKAGILWREPGNPLFLRRCKSDGIG